MEDPDRDLLPASRDHSAGIDEEELRQLVEAAQAGQPEAERELHRGLSYFVRRRLEQARRRRNWFWLGDIEVATQEVLAQFFLALREGKFAWRGPQALEGFLTRTAFFVAMDKKDRAVKHRALSLDVGLDKDGEALGFDVAAFGEAVYDRLDRQECYRLLAEAIGELNENRRDVIERTLLGQKVREICAVTGRTPASVSGLKFNALVELRQRLGEKGFLERCGELFRLEGGEA